MSIIKEFKDFALKGNVIDLAVGVVIGGAFGKVVSSLVTDIIMPIAGFLTGGIDFSNLKFVLQEAADGHEAVTINYGLFINSIISLFIIAASIFSVIRIMNKLKDSAASLPLPLKKGEEAKAEEKVEEKPAEQPVVESAPAVDADMRAKELEVLMEIRDALLKANKAE